MQGYTVIIHALRHLNQNFCCKHRMFNILRVQVITWGWKVAYILVGLCGILSSPKVQQNVFLKSTNGNIATCECKLTPPCSLVSHCRATCIVSLQYQCIIYGVKSFWQGRPKKLVTVIHIQRNETRYDFMRGLCCEDDSGEINVLFPHEKPSPTTTNHHPQPNTNHPMINTNNQQSTTIQYHPLTTNINHQLPSNQLEKYFN